MKSKDENSIWAGIHENSMSEKGQKSSIWSKPERVPGGGWNVAYRKSTCKVERLFKSCQKSDFQKSKMGSWVMSVRGPKLMCVTKGECPWSKFHESQEKRSLSSKWAVQNRKTHLQKQAKMPKIVLKGKGRNGVSKVVKKWKCGHQKVTKSTKCQNRVLKGFERSESYM